MKVLQVLHELKFSGAEIMYVDAAPFFQKKGYSLSVIATAEKTGEYASYFESSGYRVIHKPFPFGWNLLAKIKFLIEMTKLIKQENFDVVHIHSNAIMWEMTLSTWLARKTPVHTFHSVFYSRLFSHPVHIAQRWIAKHIFGCKFQSISDTVYEHELKYYHNKTKLIYNWYGCSRFYPADINEKEIIRKQLQIPQDALVLISIGGCSPTKRHSEIIQSLPYVLQHQQTVLYLHLGNGELETAEKELTFDLGLENNIRFYGNQEDIRKFLIASDIYLMTSKHEGISITTIEAMACEIPAILYDVPGLRDFNKEEEVSILIPEDYKLLAEKIIWLYSNPEYAKRLSDRAKNLVNEKFDLTKNVSELLHLYSITK